MIFNKETVNSYTHPSGLGDKPTGLQVRGVTRAIPVSTRWLRPLSCPAFPIDREFQKIQASASATRRQVYLGLRSRIA